MPLPTLTGFSESSPAIGPDGTIYLGSGSLSIDSLLAIDPSGRILWTNRNLSVVSGPAVGPDGTIYVGTFQGLFLSFDSSGRTNWWIRTAPKDPGTSRTYANSSPALGADGTIYFLSGGNGLYSLKSDGSLRWRFTNEVTSSFIPAQFPAPSIGPDGTIYFGWFDQKIYAIRPDGSKRWESAVGGIVFGSPAIGADGTVYVGSDDGRLYAFTSGGIRKWDFAPADKGIIEASPSIGQDGMIRFGSLSGRFYALRPDGSAAWTNRSSTSISSSAACSVDDSSWVGDLDRRISQIDSKGMTVRSFLAGSLVFSSSAIGSDGSIYIASSALYSIKASADLATSSWPMFRHDAGHSGRALQCSLSIAQESNGLALRLNTEIGRKYELQSSSDLTAWSHLAEILTTNTAPTFPVAVDQSSRFYRIRVAD